MSFCYTSSSTAFPLLAHRLTAFLLRVFPTSLPPLQSMLASARALFFSRFSTPQLNLLPSSLLTCLPRSPMSPFCYSFCPARLRVFLARLLPLPDPFILLPGLPLSPSAFRHFSLFLYLFPSDPPPPTLSPFPFSLSLFLFFSLSFPFILVLCFSAGLVWFFPFPVAALSRFSSASLLYPLDVVFPVLLYSFLRLMLTGIMLLTAFFFRGIAPQ